MTVAWCVSTSSMATALDYWQRKGPLKEVVRAANESQVSLTLDTYSHALPGLQPEAAKRMDDEIGCQDVTTTARPPRMRGLSCRKVVTLNFASWNRIAEWLKSLQHLRAIA